eukprot:4985548-Pleurochrysis_carterae.AAC.1
MLGSARATDRVRAGMGGRAHASAQDVRTCVCVRVPARGLSACARVRACDGSGSSWRGQAGAR